MVDTIINIEELTQKLKEEIERNRCNIIGIDGLDGTGKALLAKKLENMLKANRISLDSCLDRNKGSYRDHIDYIRLKQDLDSFITRRSLLIIEGVLLLEILNKINIVPSKIIYVEPMDNSTKKYDFERIMKEELSDLLEYYNCEQKKWPNLNFRFQKEVVEYHKKYNPVEKVDLKFKHLAGSLA